MSEHIIEIRSRNQRGKVHVSEPHETILINHVHGEGGIEWIELTQGLENVSIPVDELRNLITELDDIRDLYHRASGAAVNQPQLPGFEG